MSLFPLSSLDRITLLIGEDGFYVVPPNAATAFFVPPTSSHEITAFLGGYPKASLLLLADTLALDFRREDLPRLNPFDRARLVERRLQQAFPQARLRASLNTKDRQKILLAGLPEKSIVFDWLDRLSTRTPVVGLLPLEGAGILTPLIPETAKGWGLLITSQRTGGIRQIVTHKGELVFTRLTPALTPQQKPAAFAEVLARDIRATLGYLARLGLTDSKQLHTAILLPESLHPDLRFVNAPIPPPLLLSPCEAAKRLALPLSLAPHEAHADLLYAGFIAKTKRLKLPLMLHSQKEQKQTIRIQTWGMRAAVFLMMIATGLAGWHASDGLATTMEARKETATLAALKQQLKEKQAQASPLTAPLGRLRQALARQRRFAEPAPSPWKALLVLQKNLSGEARLEKLDWEATHGLRADMRLTAPPLDREQIIARFDKLSAQIAAHAPHYQVKITRYPFPILPEETLTNATAAPEKTTAEFTLTEKTP